MDEHKLTMSFRRGDAETYLRLYYHIERVCGCLASHCWSKRPRQVEERIDIRHLIENEWLMQ